MQHYTIYSTNANRTGLAYTLDTGYASQFNQIHEIVGTADTKEEAKELIVDSLIADNSYISKVDSQAHTPDVSTKLIHYIQKKIETTTKEHKRVLIAKLIYLKIPKNRDLRAFYREYTHKRLPRIIVRDEEGLRMFTPDTTDRAKYLGSELITVQPSIAEAMHELVNILEEENHHLSST